MFHHHCAVAERGVGEREHVCESKSPYPCVPHYPHFTPENTQNDDEMNKKNHFCYLLYSFQQVLMMSKRAIVRVVGCWGEWKVIRNSVLIELILRTSCLHWGVETLNFTSRNFCIFKQCHLPSWRMTNSSDEALKKHQISPALRATST